MARHDDHAIRHPPEVVFTLQACAVHCLRFSINPQRTTAQYAPRGHRSALICKWFLSANCEVFRSCKDLNMTPADSFLVPVDKHVLAIVTTLPRLAQAGERSGREWSCGHHCRRGKSELVPFYKCHLS